jgi:arylsulfatase A-like enzyme
MAMNELRVNVHHECIGQALTQAGYDTAYIGKWHLWSNQTDNPNSFENGFVPAGPARLGFDGYWAAYNYNFNYFSTNYFLNDGSRLVADRYETDFSVSLALEWLSSRKTSQDPFAIFLSLPQPHDPWEQDNVPRRFLDKIAAKTFSLPPNYQDGSARYWEPQMDEAWWLSEVKPNLKRWQAVYAAMVASVDEACRDLLQALEARGLMENTIFVFTSDHGEMFGAHGRMAKNIFYEEAVRVPFLVYGPGMVRSGGSCEECLGTPDIMPTLLGALGVPIPGAVEGVDLSGHLTSGRGPTVDDALLQGMGHTWLWLDGFEWRGIRGKRFTYAIQRCDSAEFLFDNVSDPLQLENLAQDPAFTREKERLQKRMHDKMAELNDEFRECTWYEKNWTRDRIVLRGARG